MNDPIRVLHVDDEAGFAELTSEFLKRERGRFSVATEVSPTAALDAVREREFDCVVSDHDMPEMSGIELLEAVREYDADLPFILFTGKGSEEVASRAVSAGVTEYLQKEGGTEQYTLLANRIENVVERHRSRRVAAERKRRLETLVSNLPGLVYRCRDEPGWPMDEVGGECESLSGYPASAFESGTVSWGENVIHPDDRGDVRRAVETACDRDEPFECTYRIETADGGTKWVWERGQRVSLPEHEAGPSDEMLEGFITDVTESKRRSRRFEAIFDNTYQFTGLTDSDGTIVEANESALSFADIDREEAVGTPLWEAEWFQSDERTRRVAREAVETARNGELFRDEIRMQRDGEEAIVDFSVRPVTNEDGEVTLLVPEGRDITELRTRERRSRRHERRFKAVFDDPNLLVALLDVDGTTRDVNQTALAYVDEDRDSVVGRPFRETPWWTGEDRDEIEGWIADAADGEYVEYEAVHPTGGDDRLVVKGSFRPVTDGDGTTVGIVVSAKDITERERRERELRRHNERFEEFAGFVSHDLQSPLSAIRGRLQLALDTGETEHVERALDALDRVDELRTELVTALRTGEIVSETESVAIDSVVGEAWCAVDPPNAASVTVEASTELDADPDALQRLFENLVTNSVQHGRDDVHVRVGELDGGFYYEDDGPGIDPDTRTEAFKPGFSTKSEGKQTGMGLASVQQVVLAHGWEIDVDEARHLDGVRFEVTGAP